MSRQRAIATTGGAAAGVSLLAACSGGSSSSSKGEQKAAGLVAPISDETKNVKRGGIWKSRAAYDPPSFEVHTFVTSASTTSYRYSTLVKVNEDYMKGDSGEIVGDVFESREFSPDKTTITGKVNPNAHFAPVTRVNGRAVDARDVVASWDRVRTISSRRGDFVNEANPDAPILSISATDDRTVVIELKEPNAAILSLLANAAPGTLNIGPRDGLNPSVLDLKTKIAGSGAWYVSDYQPGIGFTFKRNPGFGRDKRNAPYIDQIDFPIIIEYQPTA